jgi:hypothetical protein
MAEHTTAERLDRALTVGGIGRAPSGELSAVTRGIYAKQWGNACTWRAREYPALSGVATRTFTPEQVAQYAIWLVEQGYARSTARLAVRAIRWYHRVAGMPVPDGFPATYVLRDGDSTADLSDDVNDQDRPARRDPIELLAGFASACRVTQAIGARDMCLITLLYETGLTLDMLGALDIESVEQGPQREDHLPTFLVPVAAGRRVLLSHGLVGDRGHDTELCAACCLYRWLLRLRLAGARTGPLLRSVDKSGTIAATGVRKGGTVTADGRLRARGIPENVLRPLAHTAGMTELRIPARALRLAGAAAAYARGDVSLDQAARQAGYTPGSPLLLTHLLELTAPAREDDPREPTPEKARPVRPAADTEYASGVSEG